jgi:hypothetical protein
LPWFAPGHVPDSTQALRTGAASCAEVSANRTFTALAMVNLYMVARRVPALVRPY